MKSEDVKTFLNELSGHKLVVLHNMYCSDTDSIDDYIYDNDEDFYETNFGERPMELARAINYGKYNFNDEYVVFNGYGNLDTYNSYTVVSDLICIDEIVDYYLNVKDDNTEFIHFLDGNGFDFEE